MKCFGSLFLSLLVVENQMLPFEAACPSHLFQQKVVLRNEGRIKNLSHWDVTNEFYTTTSHKSCKHTHSKVAISSYKQKYIFTKNPYWIIRMCLEDAFVLGLCNGQSILFCNMFPRFEIYVILKCYQTSTRRRCILCHDALRHLKRRACKYTQSIGIFK